MDISFADRIKAERQRLALTQASVAEAVGVRAEMWGRYERGASEPSMGVLAAFCSCGADAAFLLSGKNIGGLSSGEARLVATYKMLDEAGRQAVHVVVDALAAKTEQNADKGGGLSDEEKALLGQFRTLSRDRKLWLESLIEATAKHEPAPQQIEAA